MKKPSYFTRLKHHPGVPIATVAPTVPLIVEMMLEDGALEVGVIGAIVFAVFFWVPVLLTARTQPVPGDE